MLRTLALVASIAASFAASAQADVLLDGTTLIGLPTAAAPSEYSFTAASAQALTLTLTDFQAPAAFSAMQVAVTLGDVLVGSATVDSSTHIATLAIPAAAGNYTIHVIGTPDAAQGIGTFGACVAPASAAASCVAAYSFSGNIQAPAATSSSGTSTLNTNFTSTAAGIYTVTVTDDSFPKALQSLGGGISLGSAAISGLSAGTTQVTLSGGTTYQLLLAAVADATLHAGLYGVRITDPGGAAVFDRTLPVGLLPASSIVQNSAAQGLSLSVTDFGYPSALATVGAAVTQGAESLAMLGASGTVANFAAAAGSVEVWHFAAAGANPGVYSLNLAVAQAKTPTTLLSTTLVVNPSAAAAPSYAFVAMLPSSGTYNLGVSDFEFPATFQSISATVAQNGVALQQTSAGDFTALQGPVVVLVNATPPASASGIFDVTVQTSGASPQILLDQTQAVGGVFDTRAIIVGISGAYDATLTDLGFPEPFQDLAVVVSHGGQVDGKIFGGGTFTFNVVPGQYVLTFVATPSASSNPAPGAVQGYGLYAVRVASSAPVVTFTANPTTVMAGGAVTLTWSSQNATTCVASGGTGWAGSQMTSGTLAVVADSAETLTLTCTGAGGSAAQSVSITTTAPSGKSGGGGGIDAALIMLLGVCLLCRGVQGRIRPRFRQAAPRCSPAAGPEWAARAPILRWRSRFPCSP